MKPSVAEEMAKLRRDYDARPRKQKPSKKKVKPKAKHRKPPSNPRDRLLKSLGYASYWDYLASPLWKTIRTRAFRLKGSGCVLCGARAEEMHHRKYTKETLLGLTLEWLEPVCKGCHKTIEFFADGRKRPFRLVDRVFRRLKRKRLDEANADLTEPPDRE